MVWSPLFHVYHGYHVTLQCLPQYTFSSFHPKNTIIFSFFLFRNVFINSKGCKLVEIELAWAVSKQLLV